MTKNEREAIAREVINIYKSHGLSLMDIKNVGTAIEWILLTEVRMQGQ